MYAMKPTARLPRQRQPVSQSAAALPLRRWRCSVRVRVVNPAQLLRNLLFELGLRHPARVAAQYQHSISTASAQHQQGGVDCGGLGIGFGVHGMVWYGMVWCVCWCVGVGVWHGALWIHFRT